MPISIQTPRLAVTSLALIATFAAGLAVSAQQSRSAKLASVLADMDASSKTFQSAQADIRQEVLTKHPIEDIETRTGQIYFERKSGATQMGMKLLPPDAKPGAPANQIVEFKDGKLRLLDTGTSQIDQFNAAKNQSVAEALMTLGFGGSGTGLAKSFAITDQATEQMNDDSKSVTVEKLDLVPKDPSIKNNYSHIAIWVDSSRDVLLKQVFYLASGGTTTGDTRTVFYTNIRLNQKVDETPFSIVCKKCTVVPH
jgi:outer membrane lipoprotein-sorting protein